MSKAYGSSSALLVNSGMSAISVAIESQNLSSGDVLLTTSQSFFETSEFMSQHISVRGIDVIRVASNKMKHAIVEHKPKVIYLETVINVPTAPCIEMIDDWCAIDPNIIVIIDNTVQSHATCYFNNELNLPDNYLIVESGTKYLSEDISLGVIYGSTTLIERARIYARNTGQQLQEKCFNYLSESNIVHAKSRLNLHSRNVYRFVSILTSEISDEIDFLRPLNCDGRDLRIFKQGVGAVVYLKFKNDSVEMNRSILHRWHDECRNNSCSINIQAGFGWNKTMARIYESSFLNQKDAPNYIRISIGIELTTQIDQIAKSLVKTVKSREF
jgi:cystathionine beta-lyase/cystathionine gamma-synthase